MLGWVGKPGANSFSTFQIWNSWLGEMTGGIFRKWRPIWAAGGIMAKQL
jgi:hypothetical protein